MNSKLHEYLAVFCWSRNRPTILEPRKNSGIQAWCATPATGLFKRAMCSSFFLCLSKRWAEFVQIKTSSWHLINDAWTPLDDVANNSATSSFLCSTGDKSDLLTSRRARRLIAVSEPLRGSQSGCLGRVWLRMYSAERRSVGVCRSRLPVVKPWFQHLFPSLFIDNESYNNDWFWRLCDIMKSQKRRIKTS